MSRNRFRNPRKLKPLLQGTGFLTAADILRMKPRRMMVESMLPLDSLVMMYGPSGAGKSFAILDIMCHVAAGKAWHGMAVKAGAILYVYGEGGSGLQDRLRAWGKEHHRQITAMPLLFQNDPINLFDAGSVQDFLQRIAALEKAMGGPIAMIIFDTLARCMLGADENSNSHASIIIANADRIRRQTGASVMLVHHTPRGGDQERGATAYRGAMDTMISVQASGKSENGFKLVITKQKDGVDDVEMRFLRREIATIKDRKSCVIDAEDATRGFVKRTKQKKAANQNLSPAQHAMLGLVRNAGANGIDWPALRAQAKACGLGGSRSSGPSDLAKALVAKGAVRVSNHRIFA